MIVVDTSVWIASSRQPLVAQVLGELIDADEVTLALPVRLELWSGVARSDRKAFLSSYGALPQLHPTEDTWRPLPRWIEQAADSGQSFTISDVTCSSNEIKVVAEDGEGCFVYGVISCAQATTSWTITNDAPRDCGN